MKYYLALAAILFLPSMAYADVIITEIMYDLEGSDGGREWIEIHNTGSSAVDLTDWWFYEGGNHGFQNESPVVLSAGAYAIIADTPAKFLSDNLGVSALIIDSSAFSLRNTGDTIAIRNTEKVDVDTVSYVPIDEANGTGASLQLVSGSWIAATPTPGAVNSSSGSGGGGTGTSNDDSGNTTQTTQTGGGLDRDGFASPDIKRISVDGGPDRTVIAGADVVFLADGYGTDGDTLDGEARYLWTFGDGATEERKSALHSFAFPGEYVVVVNVSAGKYNANDYIYVTAEPSALAITDVENGGGGYVELHNGSRETLQLSYWLLRTENEHFIFPKNTRIQGGRRVRFPNSITGLVPVKNIELLYPNGTVAYTYTPPRAVVQKKVELQRQSVVQETASLRSTENIDSKVLLQESVEAPLSETSSSSTSTKKETEAAVVLSLPAAVGQQPTTPWLLVLGGFLGLIALAVLVIREGGSVSEADDIERRADRITIIEE